MLVNTIGSKTTKETLPDLRGGESEDRSHRPPPPWPPHPSRGGGHARGEQPRHPQRALPHRKPARSSGQETSPKRKTLYKSPRCPLCYGFATRQALIAGSYNSDCFSKLLLPRLGNLKLLDLRDFSEELFLDGFSVSSFLAFWGEMVLQAHTPSLRHTLPRPDSALLHPSSGSAFTHL